MGLLLSILVSCVGVVELLAIYGNVRRAVVQAQQGDAGFDAVKSNCIKDLRKERDRLRREIARLEGNATVQSSGVKQVETQETVRIRDFDLPSLISSTETPRNATDISSVNKPNVNKVQGNLEEIPPTPIKDKHTHHVFPSYIDSSIKPVVNLSTPEAQHPIVITDTLQHSTNYEDDFHREPSPFPTYDRLAPRNSLCSELLTDPISVSELDEESYGSSPKVEDILKSNFDNPDYWGKSLRPERRSKSRSRSRTPEILLQDRLDFEEKIRSKSPAPPSHEDETRTVRVDGEDIETITRCSLEDLDARQEEGIKRRRTRKGRAKNARNASFEEQEDARNRFEEEMSLHEMRQIEQNALDELLKEEHLEERSKVSSKHEEEQDVSQLVDQKYWKRSPSPFQKILDVYASSSSIDQEAEEESSASSRVTIVEMDEELDAEVLNSVDGIKHKQRQTNDDNKRQFKKKRNKRTRNAAPPSEQSSFSDEGGSVIAVDGNARDGDEGLLLEEVEQAGPSRKPGEPFWVKQK